MTSEDISPAEWAKLAYLMCRMVWVDEDSILLEILDEGYNEKNT